MQKQNSKRQKPDSDFALVQDYFREINKPDNNLGNAEVGPSPQKIRLGSAIAVLEAMGLRPQSVFVELGAGQGQVCLLAKLRFGVQEAIGYELNDFQVEFANREWLRMGINRPGLDIYHADILKLSELPDGTSHVYSFDKDFPPVVLAHVAFLLKTAPMLRKFASSIRLVRWFAVLPEDLRAWFQATFTGSLIERVPAHLSGSGEQHSFYIYTKGPVRRVPMVLEHGTPQAPFIISDD
jgi:Histone methylation protein DOT1